MYLTGNFSKTQEQSRKINKTIQHNGIKFELLKARGAK